MIYSLPTFGKPFAKLLSSKNFVHAYLMKLGQVHQARAQVSVLFCGGECYGAWSQMAPLPEMKIK